MVRTRAQRRYLLSGQQPPLHNDHYISDCNMNICPARGYKTQFMGHSGFYTSYLLRRQHFKTPNTGFVRVQQPLNSEFTIDAWIGILRMFRYLNIAAVFFRMRWHYPDPGPGHSISGKDSEVREWHKTLACGWCLVSRAPPPAIALHQAADTCRRNQGEYNIAPYNTTSAPQEDDVPALARNWAAPHHVDGVLHPTWRIWASCDQEMLRTAFFLSREMGRGAKVTPLFLMKPLYVQNKRQRKLVTRAADVLTVVASVAEQLCALQGAWHHQPLALIWARLTGRHVTGVWRCCSMY